MKQLCGVTGLALVFAGASCAADTVDFQRDVQPLFQKNCHGCHGPSQQMAGIRLDRRSEAMKIRNGTVIGPGNAAGSRLFLRVSGTKAGAQMPPPGALTAEEIELVRKWIDLGAEWPDELSGDKPPTVPDPKAVRMMTALRGGQPLRVDKNAVNLRGMGGSTALMYATLYGDVDSMRRLLDAGADANTANDAGATALMWAIGDEAKTRLLLDRGADANARSNGDNTPFSIAMRGKAPLATVAMLFEHGLKLESKTRSNRALLRASNLDEALRKLLVEHGADAKAVAAEPVDQKAEAALVSKPLGFTALMRAAGSEFGPVTDIRKLIDNGADVNLKTAAGNTALDFALRNGRAEIIEVLRKAGAREGDLPAQGVPGPSPAASVRAAIERALPLLQRADAEFLRKSGCLSCHHNSLTAATVAAARRKGIRVDEKIAKSQLELSAKYVDSFRESTLQGVPPPGASDTVGYLVFGLAAEKYPADPATDAMARSLKAAQLENGSWTVGARPPLEASRFQSTALAMRGLQVYGIQTQRGEYDKASQRAAAWLAANKPESTEDQAFKILGMIWSKAPADQVRGAAMALAALQRADGGWAQTPSLSSDAYGTAQALVALKEAGITTGFERGVKYLMGAQLADGSWYVRSRAIPFQPYFESGFPHGLDQFISDAATNWAAMALIASL